MKLNGKIAVVTGAGSGIGKAIALNFATEGATLLINDLNAEGAQETLESLKKISPQSSAFACDVSDSKKVVDLFIEVDRRYGRLDILVNNAGRGDDRFEEIFTRLEKKLNGDTSDKFWDLTLTTSDENWLGVLHTNLDSMFFCTREALKIMSKNNSGSIINLGSTAGLIGGLVGVAYSASKAGVMGFTKALAVDVASRNIRANCIAPGLVDTPLLDRILGQGEKVKSSFLGRIPLRRVAAPEEIATVALFLACDDSSFVTGQTLSPNGGSVMQ